MEIKAITLPESRDKDACYDFFFSRLPLVVQP